jgi:hypothetical protein
VIAAFPMASDIPKKGLAGGSAVFSDAMGLSRIGRQIIGPRLFVCYDYNETRLFYKLHAINI